MAAGAAQMMLQCVAGGSILTQDGSIERRPYHRNCECAMHKLKGVCSSTCGSWTNNISFPKKQAWGGGSLSLLASEFSTQSPLLPNGSLSRSEKKPMRLKQKLSSRQEPCLHNSHGLSSITHPSSAATTLTRRTLLLSSTISTTLTTPLLSSSSLSPQPDTTITDRVFLDFSLCPTYFRSTTAVDSTPLCSDPASLGRLVLGLYGNLLPLTVSTFKLMCTSSSYKNTLVHNIFPGQFFQAGRQGRSREYGELHLPPSLDLPRNTETVDSKAFLLKHSRAGIVSLCLSENDDDDEVKLDSDYRNVEFLIISGPGTCPRLDNNNIVFGTVLEDLETSCMAKPIHNLKGMLTLLESTIT
ncbi:Peptidyl-prolyl cis-trans isomerase CYP28 [Hibiscus syriacus]|uniref:Peptidyl-prolyl cis-trans isomerase CYP28 n=1 Tax=Hibiscus syriacus TaxID=106335 RepID=A0A6A3CTG3_HIBSY|nr:Peptidyl-prolyl cis-trans isomerase CYP28 [Hibiscus syriacus]